MDDELKKYLSDKNPKVMALMSFLEDQGENVLTLDDLSKIMSINKKIEELNSKFDSSEDVEYDLLDVIEELEDEIELIRRDKISFDNIKEDEYNHYGLDIFDVTDVGSFAVGSESEFEDASREYYISLIDDYSNISELFDYKYLRNFIDEEGIKEMIIENESEMVYNDTESYIDDEFRELSFEQEIIIENLERKKKISYDLIESIKEIIGSDKINTLNEFIVDCDDSIEDIRANPEGDFSDETIERAIEARKSEIEYDLEYYIDQYLEFMNINAYIDMDKLLDDLVDNESYESLATYDGNVYEEIVDKKWYMIVRV